MKIRIIAQEREQKYTKYKFEYKKSERANKLIEISRKNLKNKNNKTIQNGGKE